MYELNAAIKYSYYAEQSNWEQARLIAYVVAQTQSTKRINIEDIMKFPWEEDKKEKEDTSISKEQIAALKAQAQMYLQSENKVIERR